MYIRGTTLGNIVTDTMYIFFDIRCLDCFLEYGYFLWSYVEVRYARDVSLRMRLQVTAYGFYLEYMY